MEKVLLNQDKKLILLGNEALVRGALEAGVQFVSTYPGTPSSEIGDIFCRIAKDIGVRFEYSTNEKVALESVIGASFSGLKSLAAMKSFGLNVCIDSLLPFCYTGSKGPTVIIVGDDPSCWSSAQSEQDSRAYSYLAHIPTLEPSDPQECKDFTKLAFEISEKFKTPVLIRTTTRVAHQRAPIKLSPILKNFSKGNFIKDPNRFITLPPRVLSMKKELLAKIGKIKEFSENSKINLIQKAKTSAKSRLGVITSGVSYLYIREAVEDLRIDLPILKLGFFYPLPERKIKNFIKSLKEVLIVEELDPYLEKEVEGLAKSVNCQLKIFGKELLPKVGELKPEYIVSALGKIKGLKIKQKTPVFPSFPRRSPSFCPGCYYRLVFAAVKKVAPKNTVFGGDIGCYMLAGLPPFEIQDYLSSMGSSIGIAHGIQKATDQKLITFIGDSTFFHAGIPALINTVFNKSNPLIIILDNQTTAMTGHQPHPGSPQEGEGIKIEDIVKACGVKNLKIIDPVNAEEMENSIKEFLEKNEVSVIIARRLCWLLSQRKK